MPFVNTSIKYLQSRRARCLVPFLRREPNMNPMPTRSQNREPGRATSTETIRRHVQATDRHSKQPERRPTHALSPIVHQVVEGFMDSLQSTGEGVLPIVLLLQPELSTHGIAESDAEFARRGRRQ